MERETNSTPETPAKIGDRRVHLANERTFLAWIRTAIAIMAFGFVLEKFSLFVRQLDAYLGKSAPSPSPGYSSVFGIVLICLGSLMGVLAFLRFRTVERQINEGSYTSSPLLSLLLTLALVAVAAFLVMYLVHGM
jgi:putative membrane protein